MTELETQLLSAFEALQAQHEKEHKDFVKAYNGLHQMFKVTSNENKAIQEEVLKLNEQVNALSIQLQQLKQHYR